MKSAIIPFVPKNILFVTFSVLDTTADICIVEPLSTSLDKQIETGINGTIIPIMPVFLLFMPKGTQVNTPVLAFITKAIRSAKQMFAESVANKTAFIRGVVYLVVR